jgi:hypothetical protein
MTVAEELPRYQGRDADLAPDGIYEVRHIGRRGTVYLVDVGDAHPFRVFGWYYGYPRCCVDWFVRSFEEWTDTQRAHFDAGGDVKDVPRPNVGHHPVSGHLLCPACAAGPKAPLPYRPARHFGWADAPDELYEPSDYDHPGARGERIDYGIQLALFEEAPAS